MGSDLRVKAFLERLDRMQQRHAWAAFPFAAVKKFGEDQAGNLAALIAYYAIFSIFPLMLALTTVMGFVLHGHADLQESIRNSALTNLPLVNLPAKTNTDG